MVWRGRISGIRSGRVNEFVGMDSAPVRGWKAFFEDIDKALANMVRSGNADLAKATFDQLAARARSQGMTTKELNAQLDGYNESLKNLAFEQKLVADSQGLFGAQAQATKAKLDAQRVSADALRQAIQALNDTNRSALGGMIGFEAAIDAAAKAAKDNAGSLRMVNGRLDLNSEKSRNAAGALNDLASKTDEAAAAARESGASWSTVNGIYERGRQQLIANATQMGLTRQQAAALAGQILKTPDKTARLRGNMEDLQAKLNSARAQLKKVPDSRKAQIRATIAQLEAAIREARIKMTSIDGMTAHTYIYTNHIVSAATGEARKRKPGKTGNFAQGGLVGFPSGGMVRGPGTGTSDSILARVSAGEYVIRAAVVQKYGARLFDDINAMRLQLAPSTQARALPAAPAPRAAVVTTQSGNAGGVFEGDLYLDSEFLGAVRGVVRPMIRESEQRQAHRARVGRAT